MRVVHVVQSLGMGGQERLILDFSRELQKRGHDPIVVSMSPGGALRSEFEGIRVVDVPRKQGFDPIIIARLSKRISELKPDVVHTHNPSPLCYAVPAARALGIRRIVHTKHGASVYGAKSIRVAQLSTRMVTAFVAVSDKTRQQALDKERPSPKITHVIPNGIPLEKFKPDGNARIAMRKELGISDGAFVVGSVGRLFPEKGYDMLMRALAPQLGPHFIIVLAGEGPHRSVIEAAIPEKVKPFVKLVGLRRDVPNLLAGLDLFVLSSLSEGLPLVVPEAMAVGLPIVATAVGGLPEVVPKEVGYLVPSQDEAAFREAVLKVYETREGRLIMGAHARSLALEQYSIGRMTDRYLALYK